MCLTCAPLRMCIDVSRCLLWDVGDRVGAKGLEKERRLTVQVEFHPIEMQDSYQI